MLYLHDVWVNWFEGAIKGYQVPEFHEWHKKDKVELMDQIPLLKVKEGFFDYIEDGINEIPIDLVVTISGQAYIRYNDKRVRSNSFVVTDGKRVLAVDLGEGDTPVKKSRLIPRQEALAFEMVYGTKPLVFEYNLIPESVDDFTIPANVFMYGLSRSEREKKLLLFESLVLAFGDNNLAKARYWYSEWDVENMNKIEGYNQKGIIARLLNEIAYGWTQRHENFLGVIAKNNPLTEKIYLNLKERYKKVARNN